MTKFSDEWEVAEKMPRYDNLHDFEICIHGQVRKARLAGDDSQYLWAGTWYFTDCNHPMQNILFDRDDVTAWRMIGEKTTSHSYTSSQSMGLQ